MVECCLHGGHGISEQLGAEGLPRRKITESQKQL
jgi:hypothetical protein